MFLNVFFKNVNLETLEINSELSKKTSNVNGYHYQKTDKKLSICYLSIYHICFNNKKSHFFFFFLIGIQPMQG